MTAELLEPAARFPHRTRMGVVGRLDVKQVLVVAAGGIILLRNSQTGNPLLSIAESSPFWLGLIGFGMLTFSDISVIDWCTWAVVWGVRKMLGQTIFRRKPGAAQVVPAGTLLLHGGLQRLRMLSKDGAGAIVADSKHKTITAVLRVYPASFGLKDTSDKDRLVTSWSTFLGGLQSHQGLVGVQVLLSTSAASPQAIEDYAVAHGLDDAPAWIGANYRTLLDRMRTQTLIHESFVVVVLSTQKLRRMISDMGGGPAGQYAVMTRELGAVAEELRSAGLGEALWQVPRDVARIVREAYDPQSSPDLADRTGGFEGVAPESAGPMGFEDTPKFIRSDGSLASTWEITEWPRNTVPASFLAPLLNLDFPHSVSLLYQPRSNFKANREINSQLATIQADETRKSRNSEKPTTVHQREQEKADIEQRMQDLTSGYGEVLYVGTVTVFGNSPEELDAAEAALREAAGKCSLEVRRMWLRQEAGFNTTALPLGLGLQLPLSERLVG